MKMEMKNKNWSNQKLIFNPLFSFAISQKCKILNFFENNQHKINRKNWQSHSNFNENENRSSGNEKNFFLGRREQKYQKKIFKIKKMLIVIHLLFIRSFHHGTECRIAMEYNPSCWRWWWFSITSQKLVQRSSKVRMGCEMVCQDGTLFTSEYSNENFFFWY